MSRRGADQAVPARASIREVEPQLFSGDPELAGRVGEGARRPLYREIQAVFDLFPIPEPIAP